jgi:predicted permease
MLSDLIFGIRLLLKERAFAAAALLTLALCIGANTAIFTVLDSVVLRGLPFPDSDRLATLYNVYPGVGVEFGANAVPDYLDRRKLTDFFSDVSLYGTRGYDFGQPGSTQRVSAESATPSFFRVLRVEPVLGRAFTEEEGQLGNEKVAVLTEGFWKQVFAGDPSIAGKDIHLSGEKFRVVGVMPDRAGMFDHEIKLFVPLAFTQRQMSDDSRHNNSFEMIARLAPGVTLARAQQRIDALNKENIDRFPQYKPLLETARFGTRVLNLKDEMVKTIRPTLYLLQCAVGVVLLIGCVNLANLMLVRANVRLKELAIRFSLGAGRWRIGRQLLVEAVMLATLGGAFGILLAYAGVPLLGQLGAADLPRGSSIHIDGRVLAITALLAVATGIVFGSVPVVQLFRHDLNEVFRGRERAGTAGRRALWVRSALVATQVAMAFVLLIGSGLLTLSFARLLKVNPGFDAAGVMTVEVALPDSRYKEDSAANLFFTRLRERLATIPGVRRIGLTSLLPFAGNANASLVMPVGKSLEPGEKPPVPALNACDPGYLPAMRIRLLQGRNFTDSDSASAPHVAIIDEFLARRYWAHGDPIGARIKVGDPEDSKAPQYTVVGIAAPVKTSNLAERNPIGQVYFPYEQIGIHRVHLVVQSDHSGEGLIASIRQRVAELDPELAIFDIQPMPQRVARSLVNQRAAMTLCLVFAGLALLLSAVGLYGVLAYSVTQRTREIGIRTALGAAPLQVLRMVIVQGLAVALIGLAIGAVCAFFAARLMTTLLYDVKPADPAIFAVVTVVLAGVAALASLVPSLRALRIQPTTALRYE